MRTCLILSVFLGVHSGAEASHGWAVGVHTGANIPLGTTADWSAGPSIGLQFAKALPSGAEWRWLVRTSPIQLQDAAESLQTLQDPHGMALDAVSIHTHLVTGLRYVPLRQASETGWSFGPLLEGGFGLNIMRTHTDLATPTGPGRISNTESALLVQAGLGLHSVLRQALVVDFGVSGQVFATFDRGERGGGDQIGVFFGVQPGLEISGQF